ncbi:MAG: hypothetical protein JKX91_09785 [Rhizobiaceae bacterium]|nr:hypothetical protein [Rhizobiaceae bacterium]
MTAMMSPSSMAPATAFAACVYFEVLVSFGLRQSVHTERAANDYGSTRDKGDRFAISLLELTGFVVVLIVRHVLLLFKSERPLFAATLSI